MTSRRATILLLSAVLTATLAGELGAGILPTLSFRRLTIHAEVVAIGVPTASKDDEYPSTYKIVSVLKGPQSTVGEEVTVGGKHGSLSLSRRLWPVHGNSSGPPPKITKALLFLAKLPVGPNREQLRPILSGIRAKTAKGKILAPQQMVNPGPQFMWHHKSQTWDAMIAQIRADLPRIDEIVALTKIADEPKRSRAIFAWFEQHQDARRGVNWYSNQYNGWPTLESKLFALLASSCDADTCWQGAILKKEISGHSLTRIRGFCTPQGRQFLLEKLFDGPLPDLHRLEALVALGSKRTHWRSNHASCADSQTISPEEQATIIERITPLLDHQDAKWRLAAVRCLTIVSTARDGNYKHREVTLAIPALVKIYRTEKDNDIRREVITAIRAIESADFWKQLTGNPLGMVVLVRFDEIKDDLLEFDMNMAHARVTMKEAPTFRCEKLDANGRSVRTVSLPVKARGPKDIFKHGWQDHNGFISVTLPAEQFDPGRWRVTATGQLDGETWRSEPVEFTVPEDVAQEGK